MTRKIATNIKNDWKTSVNLKMEQMSQTGTKYSQNKSSQNRSNSTNAAIENHSQADDYNRHILINSDDAFKCQGWSIKYNSHVQNHLRGVSNRCRESRTFPESSLEVLKSVTDTIGD